MINYDKVLLEQKLIRTRLLQQRDTIYWSFPYINLSEHVEELQTKEGFKWFHYTFTGELNKQKKEFEWIKINNGTKNDEFLYQKINEEYYFYLYNLPYHFGINNKRMFLNRECHFEIFPGTSLSKKDEEYFIYQNSKETNRSLNDYIIILNFFNQNFLTFYKDSVISFTFTEFYEKGILSTDNVFGNYGTFYLDITNTPEYTYYKETFQSTKDETKEIKINFEDILNKRTEITVEGKIEKTYPCYFTGMPLQEQLIRQNNVKIQGNEEIQYDQIFGDISRGEEQMYKLMWNGEKYVRNDYIKYSVPANLNLRLY